MSLGPRLLWLASSLALSAVLILVWQEIADRGLVSPIFLPAPDRVWSALVKGFQSGDLGAMFLSTVGRLASGWTLASILGIALGAVIGSSLSARLYLAPTLEFLRPMPSSAVIPLGIALLGLSDQMVLAVITFGTLWPILLSTIHGFESVEPRLYEVSRMLGLSSLDFMRKVALPNALPDILSGMRYGVIVALILSVVGEMMASRHGVGMWMLLAARSFRTADLFAGVVLLSVIGYASTQLLDIAERQLRR